MNYFNFKPNSQNCAVCKSRKEFFCYGGNNLTTKKSFWRLNSNSTNFLKCPNELACLGELA